MAMRLLPLNVRTSCGRISALWPILRPHNHANPHHPSHLDWYDSDSTVHHLCATGYPANPQRIPGRLGGAAPIFRVGSKSSIGMRP